MKKKTAERRWTVMVVPHGSGASRAVEVSQTVLKALVGIGSILTLLLLVLGGAALSRGVNITRSRALERENRLLAGEIQHLRDRLVGLRDTLTVFSEREQALRLLAGLSPTDAGVQRAGIGGPAGVWSERDSLAAAGANGEQVLAARVDMEELTRRANILVRSIGEAYDSMESHQARLAALPSIMPTKGWLTSAFARERSHPILHLARPHEGIDVTAPMGAEIEAPAAGVVTEVKWVEGYGNMLTIDHGYGLVTRYAHCSRILVARPHEGIDVTAPMGAEIEAPAAGVVTEVKWVEGYGNMLTIDHGYGLVTRYAHCSRILVARGQRVKRGQKIALVGATGLSTGPHLHYEVWVNGRPVDPMRYVLPDAIVD